MLLEELLKELGALRSTHASNHLWSMIEATIADDVPERTNGSGLLIAGTEHQPRDARIHDVFLHRVEEVSPLRERQGIF